MGRLTEHLGELTRYQEGIKNKAKGVSVKINRFPKMTILWYAVMKKLYNLPDSIAKPAGYVAATYYAALKQIGRRGVRKGKKTKQHDFEQTPRGHSVHETKWLKFPFGLTVPYDDGWVMFDGKKYDAQKFDRYMANKFGPRFDLYYEYLKFAEQIVEEHPDEIFWNRKWFELWKEIRDLDWSEGQLSLF